MVRADEKMRGCGCVAKDRPTAERPSERRRAAARVESARRLSSSLRDRLRCLLSTAEKEERAAQNHRMYPTGGNRAGSILLRRKHEEQHGLGDKRKLMTLSLRTCGCEGLER